MTTPVLTLTLTQVRTGRTTDSTEEIQHNKNSQDVEAVQQKEEGAKIARWDTTVQDKPINIDRNGKVCRAIQQPKTTRVYKSTEEALASKLPPEDISTRYKNTAQVKYVYYVSFDLYTEKSQSHAESIQQLFDKIQDHNKEAAIKVYLCDFKAPDLIVSTTIWLQYFTQNSFKDYFYNIWDTMTGKSDKPYRVHGKVRLE